MTTLTYEEWQVQVIAKYLKDLCELAAANGAEKGEEVVEEWSEESYETLARRALKEIRVL